VHDYRLFTEIGGKLWALALHVKKQYCKLCAFNRFNGNAVYFNWLAANAFCRKRIPLQVQSYLLDSGSLTERLIGVSAGNFRVQLLKQGFAKASISEAKLLGLKAGQKAWVREVLLLCHDEPWVYARSVIPINSLNGKLRHLRRLQNSSLGALLFKDPTLKRSHFECCCLEQLPNFQQNKANKPIYGRRSVFHLYNKPLLVAEHFLPACEL
jgi:chorismate--pyruvate lyase